MLPAFIDPDLYQTGTQIPGRYGRSYIVRRAITHQSTSTPSYTPTTISPRLRRSKPQAFFGVERKSGKQIIIKAVHISGREMLVNEVRALDRLTWISYIPGTPRVAPHLIEYLMEFEDTCFFVFEWLDPDEWRSLAEIVETSPLTKFDTAEKQIQNLKTSLLNAIHWLHTLKIVHGDLKDEHVFCRIKYPNKEKRPGEMALDFTEIRIIDLGTCYLGSIENWKGASLGFSTPYFWDPIHRLALSQKELNGGDWYSAYTVLYYAFTGECFPTASPAYRLLADTRKKTNNEYFAALNKALKARFGGVEQGAQKVINDVIDVLSYPDHFYYEGYRLTSFDWWNRPEIHPVLSAALLLGAGISILLPWGGFIQILLFTIFLIFIFLLNRDISGKQIEEFIRKGKSQFYIVLGLSLLLQFTATALAFTRTELALSRLLLLPSLLGFGLVIARYFWKFSDEIFALGLLSFAGPWALPNYAYPLIVLFPGLFLNLPGRRKYFLYLFPAISTGIILFSSGLMKQSYLPGLPTKLVNSFTPIKLLTLMAWLLVAFIASFYQKTQYPTWVRLGFGIFAIVLGIWWPILLELLLHTPIDIIQQEFWLSLIVGAGTAFFIFAKKGSMKNDSQSS